ncbi:MAG TPA: sigma-54-dependent Fis family transcriptional regulator, partial [bacterium (Candidatus Stahlbacteria)]|nr:sigma-54-dependent Fis family transcriptional regulator [Candidatus Stahlbacteria bacterium]
MMDRVAIIDDDKGLTKTLSDLLKENGYKPLVYNDGRSALKAIPRYNPDVILLDLKLPDTDGFKLYHKIIDYDPGAKIIILSAFGSVETGMEAAKLGAFDFIEKPFSEEKILLTIKNAIAQSKLESEIIQLKKESLARYNMVGVSKPMATVFKLIDKAASSHAPVLILGESGVGKDLASRAIHSHSRIDGKFVKINCAAIPAELVESELFGYEPGAFTDARKQKRGKIEIAEGGTLFLDEIGDMSIHTQAKLLRFLEEGEFERLGSTRSLKVKTRIIAATNKKIEKEIKQDRFREDLYYRLNVIRIEIPPLRERPQDIPVL